MCGVFGFVTSKDAFSDKIIKFRLIKLLKLSQTRGKDASGMAFTSINTVDVLKRNIRADKLIKLKEFDYVLRKHLKNNEDNFGVIGHSRMVTNGSLNNHNNNQPVIKSGFVIVHNGIIVNEDDLWEKYKLNREFEVDTEIIPAILGFKRDEGKNSAQALAETYTEIKGSASIAILNAYENIISLASNNGSLYVAKDKNIIAFASEENMLLKVFKGENLLNSLKIFQITRSNFAYINCNELSLTFYNPLLLNNLNTLPQVTKKTITDNVASLVNAEVYSPPNQLKHISYENLLQNNENKIKYLKRCTKCLLPETFPNIYFNEKGVCSICNSWKKIDYLGEEKLKSLIPLNKDRNNNILLPLSGGRDSCFALHYLKKELNLNPITYTYDWGMVTDLARRNISRMTSELQVEHILISADIRKKREYIRMNVNAWLKRPKLGTVPLFMAGDKQFFYYANQLKKQFDSELVIFGMNPLERTDFKVAFTGIKENFKENRHYNLSQINKLKIVFYYGKEFFLNPSFINKSLIDTFEGFLSYYFIPHTYKIFYEYFPWNEDIVNNTIINEYGWETAKDTPTTWRIGDGTAAFYNYIYNTVVGFTENDTFRSNQIRQGLITREKALLLMLEENKPRYESIKWYCDTIRIDFETTIKRINEIKKLYE